MTHQPSAQDQQITPNREITSPTSDAPRRLTVDDILPKWQRNDGKTRGGLTKIQRAERDANTAARAAVQAVLDLPLAGDAIQALLDRQAAASQETITGLQRELGAAIRTNESVRAASDSLSTRNRELGAKADRLQCLEENLPSIIATVSQLAAEAGEYADGVSIGVGNAPTISYQLGEHSVVQTVGYYKELKVNSGSGGVMYTLTDHGLTDRQINSVAGYLAEADDSDDETDPTPGTPAMCTSRTCTPCRQVERELGQATTMQARTRIMDQHAQSGIHADLADLANLLLDHTHSMGDETYLLIFTDGV